MVLVSDSWISRYAVRSTASGSGRAWPMTSQVTFRPVAAKEPISSSSRASPAAGSVGSRSPGWRSSPTVSRSSSSAASLARWMCPSDSRAFARSVLAGSSHSQSATAVPREYDTS